MSDIKRKLSLVEQIEALSEEEKIELINKLNKKTPLYEKYLIVFVMIAFIFFIYQKIPYWEFLNKCHAPSNVCSCMVQYIDKHLTRDEFALLNDDLDMMYSQGETINGFTAIQMVLSNTKGIGTFLSSLSICKQRQGE